jgi:hypothetical protein
MLRAAGRFVQMTRLWPVEMHRMSGLALVCALEPAIPAAKYTVPRSVPDCAFEPVPAGRSTGCFGEINGELGAFAEIAACTGSFSESSRERAGFAENAASPTGHHRHEPRNPPYPHRQTS